MEKYTDQEFFYKQTPVNYDGIAKFTSIKGNTIISDDTLLSFNGTGIKTVGFNQWDEEWVRGYYNNPTGALIINENTTLASKNHIKTLPDTQYYFNVPRSCVVFEYDSEDNFINRMMGVNGLYTPSQNTYSIAFYIANYGTSNSFNYNNDICINISDASKNGTYEPYTTSTTSLPISTYFPTGMKRAGNVYDELTESKAITRVGAVDLGTLNWTYNANYGMYTGGLIDVIKKPSTAQTKANVLCANRTTATWSQVFNSGKESGLCGVADSGHFGYSTTETDPSTFKQSMSGVYLYYELATETETDAEDIFYKFYADGTEEILPVNGSSPETSPIIADIEYYDSTEGDSLYRRFWLINGDGERWDLTDKEFKSFLNNPTGLGFRKTIEVTRYGEKANKNNEVYDFPQPSGELLFYDTYNSTRYDKYNKFIRFLMSQPITLYYMIPVSYISGIANIFTLNCDVTEVQKTESKTDRILTSSIVFNGLGFYEGDEISINGTTDTYALTNEGDFPVGFEITVEGSLTKPYITLSQDGELYGEAKFVGTDAFNSFYIDSNDGEQNIILQQGGSVIPNPLSYQDLSISNGSIYVTFVKLAKGVSELSIGVESGTISSVNIKYSPKYRSV